MLSQNKVRYTEVTFVYSGEHCRHLCTFRVGSVSYGSIPKLVCIFLLQFGLCY